MWTLGSVLLAGSACSAQKPVLSSNTHLMNVGSTAAQRDIDECIARSEQASEARQAYRENPVASAATSSVVGAAAGGAGGAVFGHAAQGAAAGAVGGAVGSLTSALLRGLFQSRPPEPFTRQFVDACLREKGYDPAGWKCNGRNRRFERVVHRLPTEFEKRIRFQTPISRKKPRENTLDIVRASRTMTQLDRPHPPKNVAKTNAAEGLLLAKSVAAAM
jgi:outer membrane lipoprotein SlyB